MSESPEGTPTTDQKPEGEKPKGEGLTQADVDRIVADRLKRERDKYSDYEDLKKKEATADERIAEMEKRLAAADTEALKRRVQAAHGIADEDADLFLTGTDKDTLTAQAKRLAERDEERKKSGTHSPREGTNPRSTDNEDLKTVRSLFGTG